MGSLVSWIRILCSANPNYRTAITKIAIVDKFGQAISYPPPQRTPRSVLTGDPVVPDYVHPCIDEQLIPSLSADGSLNTVYTSQQTHDAASSSGYPMTPFIQLTPAINQEARINAMFLEHVLDNAQKPTGWKPCSDWENPIFGCKSPKLSRWTFQAAWESWITGE
jgi:hypothetical protein